MMCSCLRAKRSHFIYSMVYGLFRASSTEYSAAVFIRWACRITNRHDKVHFLPFSFFSLSHSLSQPSSANVRTINIWAFVGSDKTKEITTTTKYYIRFAFVIWWQPPKFSLKTAHVWWRRPKSNPFRQNEPSIQPVHADARIGARVMLCEKEWHTVELGATTHLLTHTHPPTHSHKLSGAMKCSQSSALTLHLPTHTHPYSSPSGFAFKWKSVNDANLRKKKNNTFFFFGNGMHLVCPTKYHVTLFGFTSFSFFAPFLSSFWKRMRRTEMAPSPSNMVSFISDIKYRILSTIICVSNINWMLHKIIPAGHFRRHSVRSIFVVRLFFLIAQFSFSIRFGFCTRPTYSANSYMGRFPFFVDMFSFGRNEWRPEKKNKNNKRANCAYEIQGRTPESCRVHSSEIRSSTIGLLP